MLLQVPLAPYLQRPEFRGPLKDLLLVVLLSLLAGLDHVQVVKLLHVGPQHGHVLVHDHEQVPLLVRS